MGVAFSIPEKKEAYLRKASILLKAIGVSF
jgi:hypothetical protein